MHARAQKSVVTGSAPAAIRVSAGESRRAYVRRKVVPWLFVLPILLINVVVVAGPAVSAVYYSMTDWNGIGDARWVGLENFEALLVDSGFRHAFRNNVIWLAMFLTVPIAMALGAAGLLGADPSRRTALPHGVVHSLCIAERRYGGVMARVAQSRSGHPGLPQ
jgi:hypothetical protein